MKTKTSFYFLLFLPIILLALLSIFIIKQGKHWGPVEIPPIEDIVFEKVFLRDGIIEIDIINNGPDPVTVPQVMVDDAYWNFEMKPVSKTLNHLQSGKIILNYPWVQGETHHLRLISRNGITFDHTIDVALPSPVASMKSFGLFAWLGILIGVIPVFLGIMWYPILPHLGERSIRFLSALTLGLLGFLGIDTLKEGLEFGEKLAGSFQGTTLVLILAISFFFLLNSIGSKKVQQQTPQSKSYFLAFLISLSIGLHNVGEGLVVGSAYVMGEVALGTSLILGFTLHNITEGLAIITSLSRQSVPLRNLILLGLLAGAPTIFGTLIGGLMYSQFFAVVFFGVATGAILQVLYLIMKSSAIRSSDGNFFVRENFYGISSGFIIMYLTGLLVAV